MHNDTFPFCWRDISSNGLTWRGAKHVFEAKSSNHNSSLQITRYYFIFPRNGFRKDFFHTVEELTPRILRFPGIIVYVIFWLLRESCLKA